jgi:hypothetical protein
VRVSFRTRDLVIVSWPIDRVDAERLVPPALTPSPVDGEYLISLVAMRQEGSPRYSQLNIRTYVEHQGEQGVYFLVTRVTLPGLVGVLMGAPFAPSRMRIEPGVVEAGGLGVSFRYRIGDESDAGPMGRHELGIFGRSRLRTIRITRGPATWRRAELEPDIRADPMVVYGFDPRAPARVLYCPETVLELEGRAVRLRPPAQHGKIERP